jgi:thiamine biosynthesis protein ThiS
MEIQLNGEPHEIAADTTIAELLAELQLDDRTLAVEQNLQLVPRTEHAGALLAEGDRLEVVTFVGGG